MGFHTRFLFLRVLILLSGERSPIQLRQGRLEATKESARLSSSVRAPSPPVSRLAIVSVSNGSPVHVETAVCAKPPPPLRDSKLITIRPRTLWRGSRRAMLQPEGLGLLQPRNIPTVRARASQLRNPNSRWSRLRRRRANALRRRDSLLSPEAQ